MVLHIQKTERTGFAGRRLNSSAPPPPDGRRPNPLTVQAEEAGEHGNPYWRVVRGAAVIIFLPILAAQIVILCGAA